MTGSGLTVGAVLEYYSDEVLDALATAVVTADKFPEEALNELRASYTHLSRAQKHSTEPEVFQRELEAAHRHLKRVCLDSLKIAVMETAEVADRAVDALTDDVQLPNDVYSAVSGLRKRRKAISIHEGRETTLEVIDDMKQLFADYDAFVSSLDDQFAGATADQRRTARRWKAFRANFVWAVVGAVLGYVVSVSAPSAYAWTISKLGSGATYGVASEPLSGGDETASPPDSDS